MPLKRLAPHRHFHLIEGVFCHVISVQLVNLSHDQIYVRLVGLSEEQELGPGESLEAGESEDGCFEHFKPSPLGGR